MFDTNFFDQFKVFMPAPKTMYLHKRIEDQSFAAPVRFDICRRRPVTGDEMVAAQAIIGEKIVAISIWNTNAAYAPEVDDVIVDHQSNRWRIRVVKFTIADCLYACVCVREYA